MNKSKMIPLSVPHLSMEIMDNIKETIETGWVSTGGRFITEFEDKIAKYVGVDKAISVQSGTAGLHLALHALAISYAHEVIVPTLTFIAAVNPVKYVNAEPVFMDCDETMNMDVDKLADFLDNGCEVRYNELFNKKSGRIVKAIIVVHVFGALANMERIMLLAKRYHLKVVEDATEALGSYYTDGRYEGYYAGTIGDIGVYSFNANKIITTGGGGMIVCKDDVTREYIKFLGIQAKTDSLYFVHDDIGYNYRMTNIQAAYGTSQIDHIEEFIATKIKHYNLYKKAIDSIPGLSLIGYPQKMRWNHWFYSVMVDEAEYGMSRDDLLKKLNASNIQTRPLWRLIHKQIPYAGHQAYKIEQAEYFEKNLINIPCSSNLTEEELNIVVKYLRDKRFDWYILMDKHE